MFTGLIETVGQVSGITSVPSGFRLRVRTSISAELALGESVAVNGVCLTVTAVEGDEWQADVGPETARVTTIGSLETGQVVNLEGRCAPAAAWADILSRVMSMRWERLRAYGTTARRIGCRSRFRLRWRHC
jgi:riboflavin synthase alpha subunit